MSRGILFNFEKQAQKGRQKSRALHHDDLHDYTTLSDYKNPHGAAARYHTMRISLDCVRGLCRPHHL